MIPSRAKICSDFSSSEFLFAISHELKNPLNAIIGFSDVLLSEMNGIGKSSHSQTSLHECIDYISEINQAAYEMNELIHDLLDIGSVTTGNFSVNLDKKINVKDAIRRSIKLNYSYALRRGISLKVDISDDLFSIKLDEKRIRQILVNLISNAIKYSPKNTEIKISAKQVTTNGSVVPGSTSVTQNNFLQITVSDQGFGMTDPQLENAFQKYQTIQNPNSGSVDSFGLGLPIVKQLVELQNGTIEIESELNKGTEIKLKFPYLM
ncbi:MAG: HAMP domain-containing sensor histidine kinase [Pseudomonadota bacterium]